MDTGMKTLVDEALESREESTTTLPTSPPMGAPQPAMDDLEERLFMQRQQHAFEMGVMRKRLKLFERQKDRIGKNRSELVHRMEHERRELRIELGKARGSLRRHLDRDTMLLEAMALPWWRVIAKWRALSRWDSGEYQAS